MAPRNDGRAKPAPASGPPWRTLALRGAGAVAGHFFTKLFVLPLLAIGAVMWALLWCGVLPRVSALIGDWRADQSAPAQVERVRLVCEPGEARDVAVLGVDDSWIRKGGCLLTQQVELSFKDAGGAGHRVVLRPTDWGLRSTFLDDRREASDQERTIPAPSVVFALGPGVEDRLREAAVPPDGNQLQALTRFASDRWLWTHYAWLRPQPGTPVELRYRTGDPGHAWLGRFIDQGGSSDFPISGVPILGFASLWILFHCGRMLMPNEERRSRQFLLLGAIVLGSPLWTPRLIDLIDHFSEQGTTAAHVHEEFQRHLIQDDGRVRPLSEDGTVALAPDATAQAAYEQALAGLWPERPAQDFRTQGEAEQALCAGVRARFEALPKPERSSRYPALLELVRLGSEGPARCLSTVAIAALDARHRPDAPYDEALAEWEFLVGLSRGEAWGDPNGVSGFRQRDFAPGVLEALRRDEQFRHAPTPETPAAAGDGPGGDPTEPLEH